MHPEDFGQRKREPSEQCDARGAGSLGLSLATSGSVSVISIGALRESFAQDLLGALEEIRCTVE